MGSLQAIENFKVVMETPIFVQKVYKLVESGQDIIGWKPCGTKFMVHDFNRLQNELLPQYFKHGNFSSFIRQLHFYGFSKTTLSGSRVEFSHPCFVRDRPNLLPLIVRKTNDAGNAQKRHIQELNERVQELEEENAQLRTRIVKLTGGSKLLNVADEQGQDWPERTRFSSPESQISVSDNSSSPMEALLLAIPGQNQASSAFRSQNSAFQVQKRFRPMTVESQ